MFSVCVKKPLKFGGNWSVTACMCTLEGTLLIVLISATQTANIS